MGGSSSKSKPKERKSESQKNDRNSSKKSSSKPSAKSDRSSGKTSSKPEDKLPSVRQALGNWDTGLSNCSAMTVDADKGQIVIGGTKSDMKNIIRIYDLQGNVVDECKTTDNSAVRQLAMVKKDGQKRLAIIYHQPAFKPANIELRELQDLSKSTTAYNATTKPAEEICATSQGLIFLNTDKAPKFKCLTELFWTSSEDSWKLKARPDISAPLTITTDEKNPLGAVFGLSSMQEPVKGGGGKDLTLLCIASYSSLAAYTLQATGSGRATWELRSGPDYRLSEGLLRYPCDICPFGSKTCLVADQSLNNICVFDIQGKGSYMKILAGEKEHLDKPRSVGFMQPKGILVVLNKEGGEIRLYQVK